MKKRLVLRNKRRFAVLLTLLLVASASIIFAGKSYGYKEPQYRLIAVREGDTLWDIARENNKGSDIRYYIYQIEKLNNISDGIIYEGTQIKIPVF